MNCMVSCKRFFLLLFKWSLLFVLLNWHNTGHFRLQVIALNLLSNPMKINWFNPVACLGKRHLRSIPCQTTTTETATCFVKALVNMGQVDQHYNMYQMSNICYLPTTTTNHYATTPAQTKRCVPGRRRRLPRLCLPLTFIDYSNESFRWEKEFYTRSPQARERGESRRKDRSIGRHRHRLGWSYIQIMSTDLRTRVFCVFSCSACWEGGNDRGSWNLYHASKRLCDSNIWRSTTSNGSRDTSGQNKCVEENVDIDACWPLCVPAAPSLSISFS